MNALSKLWEKLTSSKEYRESFVASIAKRMIPVQIRALRLQRGWSQATLARESQLTQGVISRAEDPEYGNLTVNTLVRIAAGFDCAYISRFVSFRELARWYSGLENESMLRVPNFSDEAPEEVSTLATTEVATTEISTATTSVSQMKTTTGMQQVGIVTKRNSPAVIGLSFEVRSSCQGKSSNSNRTTETRKVVSIMEGKKKRDILKRSRGDQDAA